MGYIRNPFNPLAPRPNQVITELNQANENFDILAQVFFNNDPATRVLKSDVYTFRRVNLSNATSDYDLQVGEEAIINFRHTTFVPLMIATGRNRFYELYCSAGAGELFPNNTLYTSAFGSTDFGMNYNGSSAYLVVGGDLSDGFLLGNLSGKGFIVSYIDTASYKTFTLHTHDHPTTPYSVRVVASHWISPTSWTSLGTIIFLHSLSGYILVRRLA